MIVIASPLKRDFMIDLVDGYKVDDFEFKYIKSEGMNLYFECSNPDIDKGIRHVKDLVKGSELGRTLYFTVTKK